MTTQQELKVKKIISTTAVCYLHGVASFIIVIVWATSATNDGQYVELLIGFSIYAIFFISASVNMFKKKYKLATSLMLTGGILSLPIGLIAIIFALIAKKKPRNASMIQSDSIQLSN